MQPAESHCSVFIGVLLIFTSASKSSPHIKTRDIPAVGEKPHESIKVRERSKQHTTAFFQQDLRKKKSQGERIKRVKKVEKSWFLKPAAVEVPRAVRRGDGDNSAKGRAALGAASLSTSTAAGTARAARAPWFPSAKEPRPERWGERNGTARPRAAPAAPERALGYSG